MYNVEKSILQRDAQFHELEAGGKNIVYSLYDWQKKCKWAYLCGLYLVDPAFEEEFLREQQVH